MNRPPTRVLALLGNPVGHSLSPLFQNAAIHAAGIDAVYVTLQCEAADIPSLMQTLSANGGGGNVTVPYKELAAGVGYASERVSQLGAANVFGAVENSLRVDNTDVTGILHALDRVDAPSTSWLLRGTGGSAKAVVAAAQVRGAALAILSRSAERAAGLRDLATRLGVSVAEERDCQVAINATPLGLQSGDPLPFDLRSLPEVRWAVDLVYRQAGETLWVESARAARCRAIDGREMLLAQGAASWKLWFPGVDPSLEVMRAALRSRL